MRTKGLIICVCFAMTTYAYALTDSTKIKYYDSLFSEGLKSGAYPGLSIAYYSPDTVWLNAYGNREWGSDYLVTASSLFQLGSVGKVLTAIAVLQQVETGKLDLSKDIRKYAPWVKVEGKVTLQHLLTHSAGMNDGNIGYLANDTEGVQSLEQHLRESLPTFYQNAGLEINYSNYSYALAGHLVELVTGIPFQEYVRQNILDPLGMSSSFIGFDSSYPANTNYAMGHTASKTDEGFELVEEYARPALPAGSFVSSARDMSRLISSMTRRDSLLLSDRSWELMFTRQFSNDEQLSGYSLGLEEQVLNGTTFWAKGGMLFGYLSQVVFFPDGTAMYLSVNTSDDTFLETFHKAVNARFDTSKSSSLTNKSKTDLSKYAGEYRNARYDRDGVESIISLFRGAFEIWEAEEGLKAYHNGEMHTYRYIGNETFQNTSNPNEKFVFKLKNDRVERLYRGVNIGGVSVPSTYEKTRWYNSPTFINEYYGFVPITIILYVWCLLFVSLVWVIRKRKPAFWKWKLLPRYCYFVAAVGVTSVIIHIVKALLPLVKSPMDFLFGLPDEYILYSNLSILVLIASVASLVCFIYSFLQKRKVSALARVLNGLYVISMLVHTWFLYEWNFL